MSDTITTKTSTVITSDGLKLATAMHLPSRPPKASLLIAHGVHEYSGRYAHVVEFLVARDYAVFTLDHRGHGHSEGLRGYVPDPHQAADDLGRVFDSVRGEYPGNKFFILGHSMGSMITMLFVLQRQAELDGWITSGSPLNLSERALPGEITIGRALRPLLGKVRQRAIPPDAVWRESDVILRYADDPLFYQGPVRMATALAIVDGVEYARDRLMELRLPLLILHGEEDGVTPVSSSQTLYEIAGSPDKTLKTYPQMRHEILNDPDRRIVLDDIMTWLAEHL